MKEELADVSLSRAESSDVDVKPALTYERPAPAFPDPKVR